MSFVWISLLFFSHTSAAVAVHRHAAVIVLPGCHYFLPCCGANEACKWGNGIMKSSLNNMRAGSARRDWLQVTISGINYCLCCHLIAAFQWMPPPPGYIFPPRHPFAPCQNSSSTCHSVWVLCTAAHPSTSSSPSSSSSPSPPSLPPLLPVFNYTPLWPLLYLLQPQHECKQSKSLGTLKYAWLSVTDR